MGLFTQFLNLSKHLVSWLVIITVIPSTMGVWILNEIRTPSQLLVRAQTQMSFLSTSIGNFDVGIVDVKEQYLLYSPFPLAHFGYHTEKERENGTAWAWLKARPARFFVSP